MKILRFKLLGFMALIVLLGALAYWRAYSAPFVFDDRGYVIENPVLRSPGILCDGEAGGIYMDENVRSTLGSRAFGYLSFVLDFRVWGLEPGGYHLTNVVIHILNGLLVFVLAALFIKVPVVEGWAERFGGGDGYFPPFFASLLFVLHPLQSGAVSYVSQRFTLLAAFFGLLAVVSYLGFRLLVVRGERRRVAWVLFGVAVLSVFAAMKSKEIAFLLPFLLLLCELVFFRGALSRRFLYLLPFFLLLPVVPFSVMEVEGSFGEAVEGATRTAPGVGRMEYFYTQSRVVLLYLRLLVFPVNQNLDYDQPLLTSPLEPEVFLPAVFHLLLLGFSGWLIYRGRWAAAVLIGFGVIWFYTALLVESSFIPLVDLVFEHRVYLPSAGLLAAVGVVVAGLVMERVGFRRGLLLLVIPAVLFVLTFKRNEVWQSDIALWRDAAQKSPLKARPHNNLGTAYQHAGLDSLAEREFRRTLELDPLNLDARRNLGVLLLTSGRYAEAIEFFERLRKIVPSDPSLSYNLAFAYEKSGRWRRALKEYQRVIGLNPYHAESWNNYGNILIGRGRHGEARRWVERALELNPSLAVAHYNLGRIEEAGGDIGEARRRYRRALALDPGHGGARRRLGKLNVRQGE